jgi:hypothetical protein
MRDINITDCSLYIAAYEYTGAKAEGNDFSVTRQEVDFGVKDPWTLGTGASDLFSGRIYTNSSMSGNISIPALEMS